jgi:hypothetical protein
MWGASNFRHRCRSARSYLEELSVAPAHMSASCTSTSLLVSLKRTQAHITDGAGPIRLVRGAVVPDTKAA